MVSWHQCALFWPSAMQSGSLTRAQCSQPSCLVSRGLIVVSRPSSPSGLTSSSSTLWCPFLSMSGTSWQRKRIQSESKKKKVQVIPCLPHICPCVCQCQRGDHPSRQQLLHRLGQEDVLSQEWHSGTGEDHHAQRGAGSNQIHLQWQDRHPDAEHHDFQQVLHQWESLRWGKLKC